MPEALSAELQALREAAEHFAQVCLLPLGRRLAAGEIDLHRAEAEVRSASKQAGFFTMTQPRELGGTAAGPLAQTVVRERIAACNSPLGRAVFGPGPGVLAGCAEPLASLYLAPLLAGEKRAAFAFTEPTDAVRPTHAVAHGDALVVNGRKAFVTGGADADFLNVLVDVEDRGQALLVVDRDATGVVLEQRLESLDGSHHAVFSFNDVAVPQKHLVGKTGEGMPRALRQIGDTRLALAARSVGLIRWTLDWLTAHLQAPHRSGQPLARREGVRLRYADLRIRAFAARSLLYRTARLADQGTDVRNEAMACKVYATEALSEVVDTAIQLTGANALVQGHPLERLYRQARSLRLAEGASDVLRLGIARGALEFDQGKL